MTARSAHTGRQRTPKPSSRRDPPRLCTECHDRPPLPRSRKCLDCLLAPTPPTEDRP
jgi:hypothetical protein